ncbi:Uncharacterised protein [Mycobacterium tuberculosis]|nr:Uncharacterised protein [Mycobacterium tuberculosis]
MRTIDSGRNVWLLGWRSMVRPSMYFRRFRPDAPGAVI